jgi:hypothetical protein
MPHSCSKGITCNNSIKGNNVMQNHCCDNVIRGHCWLTTITSVPTVATCVQTMVSVLTVATMCSNNDPGSCGLPSSKGKRDIHTNRQTDKQTDRHGRAQTVFFAHTRVCYYSVQKLLSTCLISKTLRLRI